jgi:hypothetical protein
MSEEHLHDQTGSGYQDMPSGETPPEKKREYDESSIIESVKAASRDLSAQREAGTVPQAEPEISRDYRWTGGERQGEKVPSNYTLEAERAARELTAVRQAEQAAKPDVAKFIDPQQQQPLQNAVDAMRQAYGADKTLPPDFLEQLQQQQAQPQPDQTQAPSEFNDKAREAMAEPQPTEQPVDPQQAERQQLEKAWAETPDAVKLALQQEIQQVTQAQQAYQQATQQASALALHSLLSQYPELGQFNVQQLPVAIKTIAASDPQKAANIEAHLNRVHQLNQASQQIQQQQAQIAEQNMKAWVAAEDQKFEQQYASRETPERMRAIAESAVELVESYGVPRDQLMELYRTQPLLRSSAFQAILADAGAYRLAQKGVAEKVAKPVPPVTQRPGTAPIVGLDHGVEKAMADFKRAPSALSAAALLTARRNSRSR